MTTDVIILTTGEQGPPGIPGAVGLPGEPGPKGDAGNTVVSGVSLDSNNRIVIGLDGGLYVSPPQLETAQW